MVAETASITPLAQFAISPLLPEVRAVCGNPARTDLYGGCLVRGIPTVTKLIKMPCEPMEIQALYVVL